MNPIKLSGIFFRELNLKTDKNSNDYYHGWLKVKDGTIRAFFFFRPDYNLIMRLVDLKVNQKLILQGTWSKRNSNVFLANDFYLEEERIKEGFEIFENNQFNF